jgi:hypothetical protein
VRACASQSLFALQHSIYAYFNIVSSQDSDFMHIDYLKATYDNVKIYILIVDPLALVNLQNVLSIY